MSLIKDDLEYYKHKFLTECLVPPFTNFKLNIFKLYMRPDYISPEKMAKMFKVKVHIIDSAIFVAFYCMKKWVKRTDITMEEMGEILDEILK